MKTWESNRGACSSLLETAPSVMRLRYYVAVVFWFSQSSRGPRYIYTFITLGSTIQSNCSNQDQNVPFSPPPRPPEL
jgi:hypothetical protein